MTSQDKPKRSEEYEYAINRAYDLLSESDSDMIDEALTNAYFAGVSDCRKASNDHAPTGRLEKLVGAKLLGDKLMSVQPQVGGPINVVAVAFIMSYPVDPEYIQNAIYELRDLAADANPHKAEFLRGLIDSLACLLATDDVAEILDGLAISILNRSTADVEYWLGILRATVEQIESSTDSYVQIK